MLVKISNILKPNSSGQFLGSHNEFLISLVDLQLHNSFTVWRDFRKNIKHHVGVWHHLTWGRIVKRFNCFTNASGLEMFEKTLSELDKFKKFYKLENICENVEKIYLI